MSSTIIPLPHLIPASLASLIFGLTPTARIKTSKEISSFVVRIALFSLNSLALQPRWNFMPLSSSSFCTILDASSSKIDGRTLGARSTTVIDFTLSRRPSAAFKPIKPAPIIRTFFFLFTAFSTLFISSRVMNENLSFTFSRPFIGGIKGDDPVAIRSLS